MQPLSSRRFIPACVLSAAAIAALAAPGAASAGTVGEQCSGVNIEAQGSSLQKVAQEKVWTPDFNTSTAKSACSGKQGGPKSKGDKPTIKYTASGSGAGLRSWGAEPKSPSEVSFASGNAFVGTDEPPDANQITEITSHESTVTPETLETIPVVQESVAIIVHLPTGCTATSDAAPGRLALNSATLEGIYTGTITNWSQLTEDGDSITGCTPGSITPVARFDQSGTTHIVKRYLDLVEPNSLLTEAETNETWNQLSEGSQNVVWPKAAHVVKPGAKGGGELIAKVLSIPGSIGYVNLAEARANSSFVPPTGGEGTGTFWVVLQNGTKGKGKSLKYTYEDPASNDEVAALGNANCKKTVYTNGHEPFPPESVFQPWNEVTTSLSEKTYTLCGLTYDLAFTQYSLLPGTSLEETTTVSNYLKFIIEKSGGQKLIENNDYLPLPKGQVLTDAEKGVAAIGF